MLMERELVCIFHVEGSVTETLYPYLFFIFVEFLLILLKRLETRGDIHGVKVCRGALLLTHLLIDDVKVDEKEATMMLDTLKLMRKCRAKLSTCRSRKFFQLKFRRKCKREKAKYFPSDDVHGIRKIPWSTVEGGSQEEIHI